MTSVTARRVWRLLLPVWVAAGAMLFVSADTLAQAPVALAAVSWLAWLAGGVALFALCLGEARRQWGRPASALPLALAVPGAFALLVGAVGLALGRAGSRTDCCDHPSDAALIARLDARPADFDRLIAMSAADAHVVRIAPHFTWLDTSAAWPRPASQLGFSQARWAEYRRLFRALALRAGVHRPTGTGAVYLIASVRGLVTGGSDKGYAYSPRPLAPLYASLDALPADMRSDAPVYRHLRGPWYLYYARD